jgi:hypothetical protein
MRSASCHASTRRTSLVGAVERASPAGLVHPLPKVAQSTVNTAAPDAGNGRRSAV